MTDMQSLHTKPVEHLRKVTRADKNYTPLNLFMLNRIGDNFNPAEIQKEKLSGWLSKALHEKHRDDIQHDHISIQLSYNLLECGQLFPDLCIPYKIRS